MLQQEPDSFKIIIDEDKDDLKSFEIISTYPLIIVKYGKDFAVASHELYGFKKASLKGTTKISVAESHERPISTDNFIGQTTLEDEKVVLFTIGKASPESFYKSTLIHHPKKFFMITNYGYFHSGFIGPFIKQDQNTTSRWIEKASNSEITYYEKFTRTDYSEFSSFPPRPVLDYCRLKLFPPSELPPPKVPKLFIDIADAVLKQDQHAFQKLCKEYIEELEEKDRKIQELETKLFMFEAIANF